MRLTLESQQSRVLCAIHGCGEWWKSSERERGEKIRLLFEPVSFAYSVFDYCIRTFHAVWWAKRNGPSTTITRTMINNCPSYNHTNPKERKKNVCIKNDISRLLIYQKTFKRTNEPKDKKKCTELQSSNNNNNNHGSIYMYIKSLNPPVCAVI